MKTILTRACLLTTIILCAMSGGSFAADVYHPGELVPGRFVVKLAKGTTVSDLSRALGKTTDVRLLADMPLDRLGPNGADIGRWAVVFDHQRSLSAADITRSLNASQIQYIEQDRWIEFFDFPSDDLFPNQWYLRNTGQSYVGVERNEGTGNDLQIIKSGTAGNDINKTPFYQNPPTDKTRVVVAIVDSGADLKHPELQGRFWRNRGEIPGNNIDDDHNGYVDDTLGYDPSGDILTLFDPMPDNNPTDSVGHGTHIAGIIAANADGSGVVGVAPDVEIMPVKIRPNASLIVAARGMLYAIANGADVINVSWGTQFESGFLREVFALARSNGIFVAIAAGNTGSNDRFFPAAYDSAFAVGASNSDGYVTYFSTYGGHIKVVAPGEDILSLRGAGTDLYAPSEAGVHIVDSIYLLADGTSMAAPMVAGTAAYLRSLRPDLSLAELEALITMGADDLLDPFGEGDILPGRDSISGHGVLNLYESYLLATEGGIALIEPADAQRFVDSFTITIRSIAGYSGSYTIEYAPGLDPKNWQVATTGTITAGGEATYTFSRTDITGPVGLRVVDSFGKIDQGKAILVHNNTLALLSPTEESELQYSIAIHGSVNGPDYDSMSIWLRYPAGAIETLFKSSGEFFDSLITTASVSGTDTGQFTVYLNGWFSDNFLSDSVHVRVLSAFAEGWPRQLGGRPGVSAACADLDADGMKELIIPTQSGLFVFTADGQTKPGFPALPTKDMTCIPAIYDVDRDGNLEIICTNENGLHVFRYDGTYAPGFPKSAPTGRIAFGYGYPNPTVTRLSPSEDSAIVFINRDGQVMAYEFNGDSYFYSLDGLFASFDPRLSVFQLRGGDNPPFVSADDLDGDGLREVMTTYTSPAPYSGLGMFGARTGQPLYDPETPVVQSMRNTYGATLADLDRDGLNEVIAAGYDSAGTRMIWVKTKGNQDFPGFPVSMPEVFGFVGQVPIAADLDLDGIPEILINFFGFDIGFVYIFNADGTPYLGEGKKIAFTAPNTFGNMTVANLTGDDYPEIAFRAGKILPGVGKEKLFVLDHRAELLPGWPVETPARASEVISSRYAPLIDDIDSDGLVELVLASDSRTLLVWDFDASSRDGKNTGRMLEDNLNSGVYRPNGIPTDVGDGDDPLLPDRVALSQNYPNPFNPETVIEYTLPRRARVTLDIFNILGQQVTVLVNGVEDAGKHTVNFDGRDVASGVYFYRLTVGDDSYVRKMVLVK